MRLSGFHCLDNLLKRLCPRKVEIRHLISTYNCGQNLTGILPKLTIFEFSSKVLIGFETCFHPPLNKFHFIPW